MKKFFKWFFISVGSLIGLIVVIVIIASATSNELTTVVPVSDEEVIISNDEGVEVKIPPYMVQEDTEITISSSEEKHIEVPDSADRIVNSVEIKLGDKEELNGVLEVKIPYDKSKLEGKDPNKVLYVVTKDRKTNELEYVLTDVDDAYVTVYTDHLSYYDLYFDSYEKDTEYEDKLRKAKIYFNRAPLEAHLKNLLNNTDVEKSAAALGWDAFNSGLGESSDFAAIAQLAGSSGQMDTFLTNFTSLGNVAFYLGIAKDVVRGLETEDYSKLQDNLAQGSVGFGIGNFASPGIQAAYAAVKLTLYYGGKLSIYVKGEAFKKFDAAYEKIYQIEVIDKFKKAPPEITPWETKYRIHWFNKILEIYKADKDKFDVAVERAITEEVKIPLSEEYSDDLDLFLAEYMQEEQSDDYWFFKSYTHRTGEELETFVKMKTSERIRELQPVFQRISNYLMFKAEKEYYQKYMDIKNRYEKPAVLTFKINGENVEKYDINIEFYKNGETLHAFNTHKTRELKHPMSMKDYVEMRAPDTVRMMVIKENGVDEYKKDFSFKFDDQTIEFTLKPEPSPAEETEPVEEEPAPAIEEPSTPDEEEPEVTASVIRPSHFASDDVDVRSGSFNLHVDSPGFLAGIASIELITPLEPYEGLRLVHLEGPLFGSYSQEGPPYGMSGSWDAAGENRDLSGEVREDQIVPYISMSPEWEGEVDSAGHFRGTLATDAWLGYDLVFEGSIPLE